MSCIAIQVKSKSEIKVAKDLNNVTGMKTFAFAREKTSLDSEGNIKYGFKTLVLGYVFIEVKTLTAELWHQIKKVAGVFKILEGEVTDQELEQMQGMCYQVVEVSERTNAYDCKERVIVDTTDGEIRESVKKQKRIITIPFNVIIAHNRIDIFRYIIKRYWYLKRILNNRYIEMLC